MWYLWNALVLHLQVALFSPMVVMIMVLLKIQDNLEIEIFVETIWKILYS